MTGTEPALYHPVSLNREYLAGKMLERFAGSRHRRTWENLSMENRVRVREAFLAALMSLEESLATDSPAFLSDHACWVQSRFAAMRFPERFAVPFFSVFREVLSQELPSEYRIQAESYATTAVSVLKSDEGCRQNAVPLSPAARTFLRHLYKGEDSRAIAYIETLLAEGTPLRTVYAGILEPVLHEMGRLWQEEKLTVAQEHFASGLIRRIMDRQHDKIARGRGRRRGGKTLVAACVGEELHEIGIRMVADFFEMDGWYVYYTGANTPPKSILDAVREQNADALALSITIPSRLPDISYLIRLLRAEPDTARVKVIVGGNPFSVVPGLWIRIGADAMAASAEEAVAAANQLTA